jgi:hypothetical protein
MFLVVKMANGYLLILKQYILVSYKPLCCISHINRLKGVNHVLFNIFLRLLKFWQKVFEILSSC